MALAYLFECHFKDGTFLQQTQEDVSKTNPIKSAFSDVKAREDDVIVFGIVNADFPDKSSKTIVVDLRDGHFEVNGIPFFSYPTDFPTDQFSNPHYRLIYFRRNRHTAVMGNGLPEAIAHTTEFHVGWQTTIDGKNYQQTISVF